MHRFDDTNIAARIDIKFHQLFGSLYDIGGCGGRRMRWVWGVFSSMMLTIKIFNVVFSRHKKNTTETDYKFNPNCASGQK